MLKVCLCFCHDTDMQLNEHGVDVANAIDAAIACPICINMHCDALVDPDSVLGPRPRIVERTAEERAAAWELYLREQQRKNMC